MQVMKKKMWVCHECKAFVATNVPCKGCGAVETAGRDRFEIKQDGDIGAFIVMDEKSYRRVTDPK